jgi:hypothetical protein
MNGERPSVPGADDSTSFPVPKAHSENNQLSAPVTTIGLAHRANPLVEGGDFWI